MQGPGLMLVQAIAATLTRLWTSLHMHFPVRLLARRQAVYGVLKPTCSRPTLRGCKLTTRPFRTKLCNCRVLGTLHTPGICNGRTSMHNG